MNDKLVKFTGWVLLVGSVILITAVVVAVISYSTGNPSAAKVAAEYLKDEPESWKAHPYKEEIPLIGKIFYDDTMVCEKRHIKAFSGGMNWVIIVGNDTIVDYDNDFREAYYLYRKRLRNEREREPLKREASIRKQKEARMIQNMKTP